MDSLPAVNLSELLDRQKLGRGHLTTLILCILIIVVDGADTGAALAGAPSILRAFQVERSAMGLVFGAATTGILIGSLTFGYIGDRYGRKIGAIAGVVFYSLPALATVFVGSMNELMVLRFITGLGIGGVIPNTIALLNEAAPKRYRASFVMFAFLGYSLGSTLVAQVAAWLVPIFGWSVVFLAAGLAGTLLCAFLVWLLPESMRYLAVAKPQSPQLLRLAQQRFPDAAIGPGTRFVLGSEETRQPLQLKLLFAGDSATTTPLLWLTYIFESLTYITIASWFTVLIETAGLTPLQAALTLSYAGIGGIVAILIVARPLDRLGPLATVAAACISIVGLVTMGTPGLSPLALTVIGTCTFAMCAATHNTLNGTVAMFYPTSVRGNGVGFATSMGRLGGIAGPVIAGYILSAKLPLQEVWALIAAPYIAVAILSIALGRRYRRKIAAPALSAAAE